MGSFDRRKWSFLTLVALWSPYNAIAATQHITDNHFLPFLLDKSNSSLVVSLSGGPVWENAGQTQTVYLTPDIEKTYVATNKTNTLADGEFFIGVQGPSYAGLEGQLGFAVATTSNANLSGNIWDDADPTFNNYIYGYQVQHTHIAVKGKLLTDHAWYTLKPYVSGSVGVGFNRAQNFKSMPIIFEAVETPNFGSYTSTAFTYTVGAGLQKNLDRHVQVGIGYEFADWGRNHLGRSAEQTIGSGLALNHLYTNGVLFNLTYIA